MQDCIRLCESNEDKLFQWCDCVKTRFSIENGIYLPLDYEQQHENGVVPVRDIHEYMVRCENSLAGNASRIQQMSIEINDMKSE